MDKKLNTHDETALLQLRSESSVVFSSVFSDDVARWAIVTAENYTVMDVSKTAGDFFRVEVLR